MTLPALTLIIGGAASGKSAYAEALVRGTPGNRIYIATAQAFDDEMTAKIATHRAMRANDGWRTLEAPQDLTAALAGLTSGDVALLDCATFWLSNVMLAEKNWPAEADALIVALSDCACPIVIVTNEIGQGIVPDNKLARAFRTAQGALNQRLAAKADLVVAVMAGLPMTLKGTAP